jgi:hypothetical protein
MAAANIDTKIARVVATVGQQLLEYAQRTMATWDAGQEEYVGIPETEEVVRGVLLARIRGDERPADDNGWGRIQQRIWDELASQGL